ncbi:MAG: exodeoxyribonuclease VII small subunit [Candidatus Aureabacteria bacterium]|nr:exodeoxyribonuclease VII small subunit [Candidatus Auribacterota bacterium]
MKFEEALNKLERIVDELESGDVSLEKSIQKFEEGMKLVQFCGLKLQEVEKKVEMILKDKKGRLEKVPFDSGEEKDVSGSVDDEEGDNGEDGSEEELLF